MGGNFGIKVSPMEATKTDLHAGYLMLDAPAGKYGFLRSRGDNFIFEDGTPIRFWGTNLVFKGAIQTKANSEKLADHFAKYGYNCIRIHGIDNAYNATNSGILASSSTVTEFHAESIDKLDYLIYQLKLKGIYTKFSTHVNHKFGLPDVTDQVNLINNGKVNPYFDEQLEAHYKLFLHSFLSHVNPYTGLAYKDDPAIAIMELANEDGPLDAYLGGSFNGLYANKLVQGKWATMINDRWHQWLSSKYGNTSAVATAWNEKVAGPNQLVNNTYSNSFQNWFHAVSTANGVVSTRTYDAAEGAAKISNTTLAATTANWHVQFGQSGTLSLKAGTRYVISFDIKASAAGNVAMELVYNTPINGKYGNFPDTTLTNFMNSVAVTTGWVTKTVTWNCKETVIGGNIKIDFALGKYLGDVWIKNFVVQEAPLKALDAGETLEGKTIARPYIFQPFDDYTPERQADTVRFYYELEDGFNKRIIDYAKNVIGIKQPTIINNWYQGGNIGVYAQSRADIMDYHLYWDHPSNWDPYNFTMHNKSPIGDSSRIITNMMCMQAVKDKPYIMSEVDNTFPGKYEYEFFPVLVPFASLHNLQGIFKFAFTHYDISTLTDKHVKDWFNCTTNPLQRLQCFIYSIVFTKGYIKPANTEVVLQYTPSYAINTLRRYSTAYDYNLYPPGGTDFPVGLAVTHKVRKQFLSDGSPVTDQTAVLPNEMPSLIAQTVHTSDTGEIIWDRSGAATAYVKVDAPKFQSLTGRIAGRALATTNMSINVDTDSSVSLLALDDKPIRKSKKMVLALITEQQNSGQVKDQNSGNMTNWGTGPVQFTQIVGTITLTVDNPLKTVVYGLNYEGKRTKKIVVSRDSTSITFKTNYYTPWYLIVLV